MLVHGEYLPCDDEYHKLQVLLRVLYCYRRSNKTWSMLLSKEWASMEGTSPTPGSLLALLSSTLFIVPAALKWAPLKAGFQAAGVGGHGNSPIAAGAWPGTQICQCGRKHSLPRKAAWRHRRGEGKVKNKEWSWSVLKLRKAWTPGALQCSCFGKGVRALRLGASCCFQDLKFTETLEIEQPDLLAQSCGLSWNIRVSIVFWRLESL